MKKVLFSFLVGGTSLVGIETAFAAKTLAVREENPTNTTPLKASPPVKKKVPSRKYTITPKEFRLRPTAPFTIKVTNCLPKNPINKPLTLCFENGKLSCKLIGETKRCITDKGGSLERVFYFNSKR